MSLTEQQTSDIQRMTIPEASTRYSYSVVQAPRTFQASNYKETMIQVVGWLAQGDELHPRPPNYCRLP